MTAPLISDATLAKIVRLAYAARHLGCRCREDIIASVVDDQFAAALEQARGACAPTNYEGQLIAALESANEEAARTHDERERWFCANCETSNDAGYACICGVPAPAIEQSGIVVLADGTRLDLSDREAVRAAAWRDTSDTHARGADDLHRGMSKALEGSGVDVERIADGVRLTALCPSEAEVDAQLRAEGVDPVALGERGAAFARLTLELKLARSERDEARAERDALRVDLAAAKKGSAHGPMLDDGQRLSSPRPSCANTCADPHEYASVLLCVRCGASS